MDQEHTGPVLCNALRCHITQKSLLLREEPGSRDIVWDMQQKREASLCCSSAACTSPCPWPGAGHELCQRCAYKSWSENHHKAPQQPAPSSVSLRSPGWLSAFSPNSRCCSGLGGYSTGCRNAPTKQPSAGIASSEPIGR